jgi:tRNA threonylcarbamoyl adenosine modification protein YjeE
MYPSRLLWEKTLPLELLTDLTKDLYKELKKEKTFHLWLQGELGTGKTTISKELLYHIGLEKHIKVTSPSFTLMSEYKIKNKWYAHLDLYRYTQDTKNIELEDIFGLHEYSAYIVEWPKNITIEGIKPSHQLNISYTSNSKNRKYQLYLVN